MKVNRRKAVGMRSPKIIKLDDIKFDKSVELYQSMVDALRKNQITNHLDDTQLEALVKVMKPCEYTKGKTKNLKIDIPLSPFTSRNFAEF